MTRDEFRAKITAMYPDATIVITMRDRGMTIIGAGHQVAAAIEQEARAAGLKVAQSYNESERQVRIFGFPRLRRATDVDWKMVAIQELEILLDRINNEYPGHVATDDLAGGLKRAKNAVDKII